MSETSSVIYAKVFRGDMSAGYLEDVPVISSEPLSVMSILARIHDQDITFACRTSVCYKGKCGSCLVRVNGKDVFGCTTIIHPGETVVIEPHSKFKNLRDLVVDFSQPNNIVKSGDCL